ncbi:hypothetical protein KUCAC02_019588, partial [Chaenocephalus aceratus]
VSKVKQTLNVAAVSLLPRETRQLICYQVGYVWGTAAHPTSRLLYLSQAVRVEWPHRTTHYGNMSSGCCGECSCPQCWQRGALSTLGGTDSVHPRLQQHWVKVS